MYLLNKNTRFSPMSDANVHSFFLLYRHQSASLCEDHQRVLRMDASILAQCVLATRTHWHASETIVEYTRHQKETGVLVDNHTRTFALGCNSFLPLLSCMSLTIMANDLLVDKRFTIPNCFGLGPAEFVSTGVPGRCGLFTCRVCGSLGFSYASQHVDRKH